MYKIVQINKEEYKKCEVEIIERGRYFWGNRKDLDVESIGHQFLTNVIQKNKNTDKNYHPM